MSSADRIRVGTRQLSWVQGAGCRSWWLGDAGCSLCHVWCEAVSIIQFTQHLASAPSSQPPSRVQRFPWERFSDERLLKVRLKDLGVSIEGTWFPPFNQLSGILGATRKFAKADIITALLSIKGRQSVLGTYDIDQNGDTSLRAITIYRIKGGQGAFDRLIIPKVKV